jgi:hypothetical protein
MLISGEWHLCDDGVTRPVVRAHVFGAEGRPHAEDFLIDSGPYSLQCHPADSLGLAYQEYP